MSNAWFTPRLLYRDGYPAGVTSALRALPAVRKAVRDEIAAQAPRRILEIGPGDAPVTDGLPGAVFLDVAPIFLRDLDGARVIGDLFAAPFAPQTFDLVVASDVLTHIRPAERMRALDAIWRLGKSILIFNPEPGTEGVAGSQSPTRPVADFFSERGMHVVQRKFVATSQMGEYVMRLVKATPLETIRNGS